MQYCAPEYVELLRSYGVLISMSRTGNPYDNSLAESFVRMLKCEEVYLHTYHDRQDALRHIQEFLDDIYNCKRLHSISAIWRRSLMKPFEGEVATEN